MTAKERRLLRSVERKRLRLERKYTAAIRRILHSETVAIRQGIEQSPLSVLDSLDSILSRIDLEGIYKQMYTETANAFRIDEPLEIIKAIDSNAWATIVNDYIASYGLTALLEIRRTTKNITIAQLKPILDAGLRDGLSIAQIATNMQRQTLEYAPKVERYRAVRIARTEIVGVSNWATMESVRASDSSDQFMKRWLPALQENTRPEHAAMANQPAIELDEMFSVGGEELAYPADPNGSAANTINCRCTVIFVRK